VLWVGHRLMGDLTGLGPYPGLSSENSAGVRGDRPWKRLHDNYSKQGRRSQEDL
jgi:hypothetical protein